MNYYAVQTDEYLEHHGILGQKWGVRRTPAQLGHATTERVKSLSSKIKVAKTQHDKNVVDRNNRKTAKIESKNAVLRKKAETAELKARIKTAKHESSNSNKNNNNQSIGQSVKSGINKGVKDGLSDAGKHLITTAISSAVTKHYSNVLASPHTSAGKKAFANLMGGDVNNSTQHYKAMNKANAAVAKNRKQRAKDEAAYKKALAKAG